MPCILQLCQASQSRKAYMIATKLFSISIYNIDSTRVANLESSETIDRMNSMVGNKTAGGP